ncbi:MAG: aminotransferase class IV [Pseudomonadota bacterium]
MSAQQDYGTAGVGFIDGEYSPISELRLPVTDMGFQLSDMCYDAIHVWNGGFFRLEDHLDRWDRSIAERRYDTLDYDRNDVADVLAECVRRADLKHSMVTFVATRGTPIGGQKDLRTAKNRLIVWALPYYGVTSDEETANGCDIVIANTVRIPPDAVDPTVKNFGRLDFVQALFEAYDRNARYALLLDQEGHVTEGRGWNIFALLDGTLISPDDGVLEGITRRTVFELSQTLNLDARLGKIKADELRDADEVFITSTAGGIVPVKSVDGEPIGEGQPGPTTQRLTEMYWALHDDPQYMTPINYEATR